jgi:hypothetical protein
MRRKVRDRRSMLIVLAAQPNDETTNQIDLRGSIGDHGRVGKQSAA